MSPNRHRCIAFTAGCLLAAAAALRAAEPVSAANTADAKRAADRYALTKVRISNLLDQRLKPAPLPVNPPNPFSQVQKDLPGDPAATPNRAPVEIPQGPEAADISDSDLLRKYAATLKIGGVITRNGVLHLTVNNTASKAGDLIPAGNKDRPTYLKIISLTLTELTLGLNDTTLVIPLKK